MASERKRDERHRATQQLGETENEVEREGQWGETKRSEEDRGSRERGGGGGGWKHTYV